MKKLFLFTLLAAVLPLSAQSQSAPYRLIALGTLPGDFESVAFDINDPGQVVGRSTTSAAGCNVGECTAVLWENGTIMELGIPMTYYAMSSGINNRGQIVFTSRQSHVGFNRAVLWDNGTITDLGALADPGSGLGGAFGNNERGQIVGFDVFGAVLWTR